MNAEGAENRLSGRMAAAQQGDAAAYQALLRECLPIITAIVRAQGITGDQVEDAVQDTLLTVHRARSTYDPARPFLPWLRAIAQRRAIDSLRRHTRQRAREIHDPVAYEGHPDAGPPAGHGIEQSDRSRRLSEAVASLPEGQREAVEQLGLNEKSLEEAAAVTGRSKGALKVNLHRALKALRSKLSEGPAGDV
ncbi:MAG: sigma-70 family RNA polymerase sigma factor [Acetobacteraceae bacterium]|nr:sigma-70 family RNA polymerase sigma factor [Acetobacteraceae bacterium]